MSLTNDQLANLLELLQDTEDCEIDCEAVLARAARFVEAILGPDARLDAALARAWHDSPAYQALVPLREAGADVVLVGYEGE